VEAPEFSRDLPDELADHRSPKNGDYADAAAQALIYYLKKKLETEGSARRIKLEDVMVGEWVKKFTAVETSPRSEINVSENRPNSIDTIENYLGYFERHIREDPLMDLKMTEVEEQDVLDFSKRMSVKKLKDGRLMGGTRTYVGVVKFVRMTFKTYQVKNKRWINPFQGIKEPKYKKQVRDALTEDEVVMLFSPGVLRNTMELAVCACMFLSGLRCAEIFALKPECLDFHTPKIKVKAAWQCFNKKTMRILGTIKGKNDRVAPFDPILQEAIKKLWEENGKHEFVFCQKDGKLPSASWFNRNFHRWLKRAGIEQDGREIVPHSSRHSLASLLESRGVPLRVIQDMLDHAHMKTTKGYLHSTEKTIRDVGEKISEAMNQEPQNIIAFKVS
jgi:site-specific recombinase XerD